MTEVSESRIDEPPIPGSGAVRLADFLNPPLPPLRQAFEDHVETVMRLRGLPRLEAERAAYEILVSESLDASFVDTPSDRCAHCGGVETSASILRPIGAGARHSWLHDACWASWREERRVKAIADLTAMGIVAPC